MILAFVGGLGSVAAGYAAKAGRDAVKAITASHAGHAETRSELAAVSAKVESALARLPKTRAKRSKPEAGSASAK